MIKHKRYLKPIHNTGMNNYSYKANTPMKDSPVEEFRKELPKGNGLWPGYDHVYVNLQTAAHKMAQNPHTHLNSDHVYIMAVLGCGDEETMKYAQMLVRQWGYL